MIKRILTALVLVPLVVLFVAKTTPVWFLGLLVLLAATGQYEFNRMAEVGPAVSAAAIAAGAAVLIFSARPSAWLHPGGIAFAACASVIVVRLFSNGWPRGSLRETGAAIAGLVYLPGLFTFQASLRETGVEYIYMLYAIIWTCDSLALYTGKYLGRRKLYPTMSPNKTVEGSLGGLAGGIIAAWLVNHWLGVMTPAAAVAAGAVVSTAGQIGDLVESMFKRDAGVKDSGAIFPGHGGVLDRMDAALFGGPALFYFVKAI